MAVRPLVAFRPLVDGDLPLLARWLAEPHVERFYREPSDLPSVLQRYRPAIRGDDPTDLFMIVESGRDIGMVQRYRIADYPEWVDAFPPSVDGLDRALGIDYLIGEESLVGKGIGSTAIRSFTDVSLAAYPDASSVVVACQQANPASWRALEKAGYRREWAGQLNSEDPSDAGPSYVYRYRRSP